MWSPTLFSVIKTEHDTESEQINLLVLESQVFVGQHEGRLKHFGSACAQG